jgi:hypothetical protein
MTSNEDKWFFSRGEEALKNARELFGNMSREKIHSALAERPNMEQFFVDVEKGIKAANGRTFRQLHEDFSKAEAGCCEALVRMILAQVFECPLSEVPVIPRELKTQGEGWQN